MTGQVLDVGSVESTSNEGASAAVTQTATEKMLPQSEVEKIVHARTRDVAAKHEQVGYQRALAELNTQQNQAVTTSQASAQTQAASEHKQMTPEDVRRIIDERTEQVRHEAVFNQAMHNFVQKMEAGKSEYKDFEEVIAPLNLPAIKPIAFLAGAMDNTADIMYDLGQNPHKIGNILALVSNPATVHLAQLEMQKLSNSIKMNKTAAANTSSAKEPLTQLTPSTAGTDSGSMTIRDWKNKYRG